MRKAQVCYQPITTECNMRVSEDYRAATLSNGDVYLFKRARAAVLKELIAARRRGTHVVSGELLTGRAGWRRSCRIDPNFFRHPSWRRLILPVGGGLYRLNPLILLEDPCP